jgi:hypothetical protein
MPVDPIAAEYLSLSFAIDRLFPGFIDGYIGPAEMRDVELTRPEPEPLALVERSARLADLVAAGDIPDSRRAYLSAQIRAMLTASRKLAGETIDYIDEVTSCFDIAPHYVPESVFEEAIGELDDLLPGTGDVRERMIAWRARYEISTEIARASIDLIVSEARRRTERFVALPPEDEIEIVFVDDKPWSGYNWYLGQFRSRVDVNTDLPIHIHELTSLIAHEAYPGHHAEHAIKEQVLYSDRGYAEHSILLINAPECLISEGIATLAESIIFPGEEGLRWHADILYPAAGIEADAARDAKIKCARDALRAVGGNAALRLHAQGEPEEDVIAYLMRFALINEQEARQRLRFISDPLWRPYIFTYHVGRDLVGKWLNSFAEGERLARFGWLLTEQITPSRMADQIALSPSN